MAEALVRNHSSSGSDGGFIAKKTRKPQENRPFPPMLSQLFVSLSFSDFDGGFAATEEAHQQQQQANRPLPSMPSQLFLSLATSQFELLSNSLLYPPADPGATAGLPPLSDRKSKIKSIALYLPQENAHTGQLEFLPAVIYPPPSTERVFIASDADSGIVPTIPRTLTKLPGFADAKTLLPAYPLVSTGDDAGSASPASVGTVEEVMCALSSGGGYSSAGAALSVPLFEGSQTVGVLLVWPSAPPGAAGSVGDAAELPDKGDAINKEDEDCDVVDGPWTEEDKMQVSRAAQSLSLALSMDSERTISKVQTDQVRVALADSLHQLKNPIQALRTFGKLLERKIATDANGRDAVSGGDSIGRGKYGRTAATPELLALAENMMVQSDRIVDLLLPMDSIVLSLEGQAKEEMTSEIAEQRKLPMARSDFYLGPASPPKERQALALRVPSQLERDKKRETFRVGGKGGIPGSGEFASPSPNAKGKKNQKVMEDRPKDRKLPTPAQEIMPPPAAAGEMETEMAFVPDVLEPILSAALAIATDRGITFQVLGTGDDAELPGVSICPKALQEAVSNILDNATKYVVLGKGGRKNEVNPDPRITVNLVPNSEPFKPGVTILVEDNGPGIRPDEMEAVFERGFRGDAARLVSGSGIGLDICRALVSRMGGILDVVERGPSQLNGTTMRLILFRDPEIFP